MSEAVDERQQIEQVKRDMKVASRTVTSQRDKLDQLKERKQKLSDESASHVQKHAEV